MLYAGEAAEAAALVAAFSLVLSGTGVFAFVALSLAVIWAPIRWCVVNL